METRRIDAQFAVSPQITPDDVAELKRHGYRAIVCNRPDRESPDQPDFAAVAEAAKAHGLEVAHLPVVSGTIDDGDVEAFADLLTRLPEPVLAYCRSGTRCAVLWSLAMAPHRPVAEILEKTRAAGYDMTGVIARLSYGGRAG